MSRDLSSVETCEVLLLFLGRRLWKQQIVDSRSVVCKFTIRLCLASWLEILIGDLLLFKFTVEIMFAVIELCFVLS